MRQPEDRIRRGLSAIRKLGTLARNAARCPTTDDSSALARKIGFKMLHGMRFLMRSVRSVSRRAHRKWHVC